MKLTKQQLKQIIRKEINKEERLNEGERMMDDPWTVDNALEFIVKAMNKPASNPSLGLPPDEKIVRISDFLSKYIPEDILQQALKKYKTRDF